MSREDPTKFWRGMPALKPSPDMPYTWSADWRQVKVLLGAKKRGANVFEAFSTSPPWWMTESKDVAGSENGGPNLLPYMTNPFANYLADVLDHFREEATIGVEFDYVEPFNEPLGAWKKDGNQEGCNFNTEGLNDVIHAMTNVLSSRGLSTKLAGVDQWVRGTVAVIPSLPMPALSKLNVHDYINPNTSIYPIGNGGSATGNLKAGVTSPQVQASYQLLDSLRSKAQGKTICVSEFGPMFHTGTHLDVGLFMARRIVQSVNYLHASAWAYWQVIDTNKVWSMINMDWAAPNPAMTALPNKKFWIMKQFVAAAPPGSKPVGIDSPCGHSVAAFYHEGMQQLSIVLVNQQTDGLSVKMKLPSGWLLHQTGQSRVRVWRTSKWDENREVLYKAGLRPLWLFSPGRSVTSYIISNVIMH